MESKQEVLLASLRKFYARDENLRALTDVLAAREQGAAHPATTHPATMPPARGTHPLSLRILDWLVTNYSKKHNIVYLVQGDGVSKTFNMFLEYKSQLKAYSKRYFDPFCRRERLTFPDADGRPLHTTVGQLNFFRWAIQNDVVGFGLRHGGAIEEDMLRSIKHRPGTDGGARPRRRELSKAAIKGCTKTHVRVTVRFT